MMRPAPAQCEPSPAALLEIDDFCRIDPAKAAEEAAEFKPQRNSLHAVFGNGLLQVAHERGPVELTLRLPVVDANAAAHVEMVDPQAPPIPPSVEAIEIGPDDPDMRLPVELVRKRVNVEAAQVQYGIFREEGNAIVQGCFVHSKR
ncbi:hypothetical protein GCM10011494_39300 [Novosphingobium endophyticum]|uniref:Uncharacterized protein n=1 Tax=Novosphingobium endophyticum TaxID=1955250 RepID=A0A916TVU7_9SPHN|nr:hypothetical protein [Novosphingobium endophyticum]GGC16561.1 hypothetical protein GCM10011494_39300 [Novosphingobium endophyticum]